jgi:hypothetical protein
MIVEKSEKSRENHEVVTKSCHPPIGGFSTVLNSNFYNLNMPSALFKKLRVKTCNQVKDRNLYF